MIEIFAFALWGAICFIVGVVVKNKGAL